METPEPNAIDRHFAALLDRLAPSPEVRLAAELVSRFRADGHICLPLRAVTTETLSRAGISTPLPKMETWIRKLRATEMVGGAGEATPLVLDEHERLYLRRYWVYEQQVAARLRERIAHPVVPAADFGQEFARIATEGAPRQKLAAFVAASSSLTVISGAPGTGKTHTVALICALLIALSPETEIALAAPTGKAAARLKEAMGRARTQLRIAPEILARLPEEAATIQRLLGVRGDSGKFRHNGENPLRADVVIIDEASMIDLALLAKLTEAVQPEARLILVGDKDQLASVESGSAFRNICTPGHDAGISEEIVRVFERTSGIMIDEKKKAVAPIQNCVVELRENFRFAAGAGIAELSGAVNRGDGEAADAILRQGGGQIAWRPTPSPKNFPGELRQAVMKRFESLRNETDPAKALQRLSDFAVLCALRRGPFGAETVNRMIEKLLFEAGETAADRKYFAGQPLMIVRNDYQSGLFNGDLGIVLGEGDAQRVYFPAGDEAPRSFSIARLPEHETAFALTVHKSQGSEFLEALVILPDQDSRVLTRELLYTAVTRVRKRVEIWAGQTVVRQTLARRVQRYSGLRDALWGRTN